MIIKIQNSLLDIINNIYIYLKINKYLLFLYKYKPVFKHYMLTFACVCWVIGLTMFMSPISIFPLAQSMPIIFADFNGDSGIATIAGLYFAALIVFSFRSDIKIKNGVRPDQLENINSADRIISNAVLIPITTICVLTAVYSICIFVFEHPSMSLLEYIVGFWLSVVFHTEMNIIRSKEIYDHIIDDYHFKFTSEHIIGNDSKHKEVSVIKNIMINGEYDKKHIAVYRGMQKSFDADDINKEQLSNIVELKSRTSVSIDKKHLTFVETVGKYITDSEIYFVCNPKKIEEYTYNEWKTNIIGGKTAIDNIKNFSEYMVKSFFGLLVVKPKLKPVLEFKENFDKVKNIFNESKTSKELVSNLTTFYNGDAKKANFIINRLEKFYTTPGFNSTDGGCFIVDNANGFGYNNLIVIPEHENIKFSYSNYLNPDAKADINNAVWCNLDTVKDNFNKFFVV